MFLKHLSYCQSYYEKIHIIINYREDDRGNVGIAIGIGFFILGAVLGTLVTCFIQKKCRTDEKYPEKRKENENLPTEEATIL